MKAKSKIGATAEVRFQVVRVGAVWYVKDSLTKECVSSHFYQPEACQKVADKYNAQGEAR